MSRWPLVGIADLEDRGVLQLGRGKVISKKDLAASPGTYPVYSSAKENDGKFGEYGHYMFDEELITWSVDGGGSLFHRPKHRFSITNVGGFVRVLDKQAVDCRYLFFVLSWLHSQAQFDWVRKAHPSVIRKVYTAFPLPPLEEQKRIVAVLDQAFAALDRARTLAEANLADAEKLFENTLDAVFERFASSDLILPLGEAVHPDCKLSYGIVQPGDEVAGGLPIVRPVDLGRPIVSLAGLKRISPDRAYGYSRTKLTGAELLLCVRGTTGEVSMASAELAGANVTRGIVPVRFDPAKVDLEFAYFQMRSPFMRKQIAAKTYGAALMQINIKDVRELRFVRPSLDIQQKAKTEVRQLHDRAERMIGDYQAKLDDLASLRQALLQQAFAGELT